VSRTVPTVFTGVGDPVGAGFVDSLARPGGNATGFISFEWSISGKWLELLKEIAPGVSQAVVLRDPELGSGASQFAVIQAAALGTRRRTCRQSSGQRSWSGSCRWWSSLALFKPIKKPLLTKEEPRYGGAKVDRVRHLASPVSPSLIKSQEPKVFCLTPDSIRAFFL